MTPDEPRAFDGAHAPAAFRRLAGEGAIDHARRLLAEGAPPDAPSRWGAASRAARIAVRRATRHEREHTRAVTSAVVEALADLQAGVDGVPERTRLTQERLDLLEAEVAAVRAQQDIAEGGQVARWRASLAGLLAGTAEQRPPTEGAVVELTTDMGPMLYPADDKVITPFVRDFGYWEAEEVSALRSLLRPGDTFVDLGAHVGYLSLVAARAVGPTGRGVAVEPSHRNYALLWANLRRAGATNVQAVNAAGWDETGEVVLHLSVENSGDNRTMPASGSSAGSGLSPGQAPVTAVALDDVIPESATVQVVKVDTQGSDHRAIRGMARTLARSGSVLLVEFWPPGIVELGDDPLDVLRGYRDLGYEARVLGGPGGGPPPPDQAVMEAAAATDGGYCTLVLRPR